jgi:hypothetical protein
VISEKASVPRYPSLRSPVDVLFLFCCVALTADVLVPEIWGSLGKTKDYPLWFWAGQQVLQGKDLYPSDPHAYFDFIYPPLSAVLLAIPAWFGKIPLYACLAFLNAAAWWITAQLSHAMTGSGRTPGQWLLFFSGFVTLEFVFDQFDLGQPNLVLLAIMLYGFWLLQHRRPWMAGEHVRARHRDQGVSGRGVPLSRMAAAVGLARKHGDLYGRVPVRRSGAGPRLTAQCRGVEDLV